MLKRISLSAITRNPEQPRQHFDPRALEDLADSIHINGLKQPITVRPVDADEYGANFMIVMGERRFRAHKILEERGDAKDILCHVRKMDRGEMHIDAILENLQREEVSAIEEAVAYRRVIDELHIDEKELARRLGISQVWRISDRLQLLGLTKDNRGLIEKGVITATQAYHMATLSPNGQQKFLKMVQQGLVSTNRSASDAAAAIKSAEDQIGFDMPMVAPKPRSSIKPITDRVMALGEALMPLFKNGSFSAPDNVDVGQAKDCIERLRLLKAHIGQIERELTRAASVAAVE